MGTKVVRFFQVQFDVDMMAEYKRLQSIGKIPADLLRNREEMLERINSAASDAFKANMLYLKARRLVEEYEREFAKQMAPLKKKAMRRAEQWIYVHGVKGKSITEKMIQDEIMGDPEMSGVYEKLKDKLDRLKETRDNLQSLAVQWNNRVSLLQSQARLITNGGSRQ